MGLDFSPTSISWFSGNVGRNQFFASTAKIVEIFQFPCFWGILLTLSIYHLITELCVNISDYSLNNSMLLHVSPEHG